MITMKLKGGRGNFFDSPKVLKALGKARTKVLSESGRHIRKTAQASLRYADGPSQPGRPPHAHRSRKRTRTSKSTGKTRTRSVSLLREFLFYKYDTTTQSVVIGPERLSTTVDPDAPHALEYGGLVSVPRRTILAKGDVGRDVAGRFTARQNIRLAVGGTFTVAARPFMGPAFATERPGLEPLWKDVIR